MVEQWLRVVLGGGDDAVWWWLRRKTVVVLLWTRSLITNSNTSTNKLYLPVKPQVYPDPCSRVGVNVGSDIPYPDPNPPNPYPCTPGVSETLAQHYTSESWMQQKALPLTCLVCVFQQSHRPSHVHIRVMGAAWTHKALPLACLACVFQQSWPCLTFVWWCFKRVSGTSFSNLENCLKAIFP